MARRFSVAVTYVPSGNITRTTFEFLLSGVLLAPSVSNIVTGFVIRHMHQLVPGRECGECTQCCIVPAIDKPDFQKEPASVCRHCDNGCKIYETRPQTCRTYYCGWRWMDIFPNDWRPDIIGVFAQLDNDVPPQFKSVSINLILVGNPLKTLRQPQFIDFVTKGVINNRALFLGLPGPKGKQAARFALNTREVAEATRRSRAEVRMVLEKILKRLTEHDFIPHVMEHGGCDMSM